MKRALGVEVTTSNEPIDLDRWADTYVRHVLALKGVAVAPRIDRQAEPMKEAS